MEENEPSEGNAQMRKCRDTRTFDRLLLAYFLGITFVSFYALFFYF
jgi:hypothetical protein